MLRRHTTPLILSSQDKRSKVENETDEESPRFSVTDEYEIVRCRMEMTDTWGIVYGLTFRYNENYYT